jgi:RNA polymerase sigma factor, sigma-70 family
LNNEILIWNGIKNNEVDSLKELYNLYYQDLFNFGKRMTSDEQLIEDALQETFISIWKYRQTSSVPAMVKQYVYKVFRNQLLLILRKRPVTSYSGELPDFSVEISFDHKIIEGEDAVLLSNQVNIALSKLTSRQREIIYYRFYENLSFDEISGIMDMQTRATYKLLARALAAMKEVLHPMVFAYLFIPVPYNIAFYLPT